MIERELLFNAAAALLLLILAWRHGPVSRRFGRSGLVWTAAGALLPVLDLPIAMMVSSDRLDMLSRPPLFAAPLPAAALLAALGWMAVQVAQPRQVLRPAAGLAAGYALNWVLLAVTPVGAHLAAPFSEQRLSVPVLPIGHPLLLALLAAALLLLPWLARGRRWPLHAVTGLAVLYFVAGTAQFAVVSLQAAPLRQGGGRVQVAPDGPWLAGWQVIVETPAAYTFHRHGVFRGDFGQGHKVARSDDPGLFLKMIGDPVVRNFYRRMFRHPVAHISVSGGKMTLVIQELEDQLPLLPGRAFSLETDLDGGNRIYRLQRFH